MHAQTEKPHTRDKYLKFLILVCVFTPVLAVLTVAEAPLLGAVSQSIITMDRDAFTLLSAGILGYLILRGICHYVRQYSAAMLSTVLVNRLRLHLMRSVSAAPLNKVLEKTPEYYFSQATSQLEQAKSSYYDTILWGVYLLTQLIVAILVGFTINPTMAVVTILLCIPLSLIPIVSRKIIARATGKLVEATNQLNESTGDLLHGTRDWKTYREQKSIMPHYAGSIGAWFPVARSHTQVQERVDAINAFFTTILYIGVWLGGGYFVFAGAISFPELLIFSQLTSMIAMPLYSASGLIPQYISGREIIGYIKKSVPESSAEVPPSEGDTRSGLFSTITYEDVYLFETSKHPISHTFSSGTKYLIIGASGSGKSTLYQPLTGINRSYRGSILIDGVDLQAIGDDSLHRAISSISQKNHIFNDTIRENIRLHNHAYGDESILAACRTAGIHE